VATTPAVGAGGSLATIVVRAAPFDAEEVDRFVAHAADVEGAQVRYAPGRPRASGVVDPVARLAGASGDEIAEVVADHPFDVTAITDDGPFFWHFTPFRDVLADFTSSITRPDLELAIGERVLILLLGVAAALAAVALLLPFVLIRSTFGDLPVKRLSFVYFSCLGLGFLLFEISLIQRLTLFLGYPTYSLTVTLASILVFTGVGAWLSGRIEHDRGRIVPVLALVVALLGVLYGLVLPAITEVALPWSLPVRVVVTVLLLAPFGLCLGMFMPVGLSAVSGITEHRDVYVSWCWAVNGFASVIGSVLTTILAMAFGFTVVLLIALSVYVVALVALYRLLGVATVPSRSSVPTG
jgi:hypothetical protein